MMKKYLSFAAIIFLSSCGAGPQNVSEGRAEDYLSKIRYTRDSRTQLCYGIIGSSEMSIRGDIRDTTILVHVPCTKEVLTLIESKPK